MDQGSLARALDSQVLLYGPSGSVDRALDWEATGRSFISHHRQFFSINLNEELNQMENNKNASNSLVFGRWPQTKRGQERPILKEALSNSVPIQPMTSQLATSECCRTWLEPRPKFQETRQDDESGSPNVLWSALQPGSLELTEQAKISINIITMIQMMKANNYKEFGPWLRRSWQRGCFRYQRSADRIPTSARFFSIVWFICIMWIV